MAPWFQIWDPALVQNQFERVVLGVALSFLLFLADITYNRARAFQAFFELEQATGGEEAATDSRKRGEDQESRRRNRRQCLKSRIAFYSRKHHCRRHRQLHLFCMDLRRARSLSGSPPPIGIGEWIGFYFMLFEVRFSLLRCIFFTLLLFFLSFIGIERLGKGGKEGYRLRHYFFRC